MLRNLAKRMLTMIFRWEFKFRKIHLGTALRLQRLNSHLAWLLRSRSADTDTRLVLISMSTYNGSRWVDEAIRSVVCQSHSNWFLFVVDDASSDETIKRVEHWVKSFPEKIHLLPLSKNIRPDVTINRSIDYFLGNERFEVFASLDQDDVAEPDFLTNGLSLLNDTTEVVRCHNSRWNEDLTRHYFNYPACSQLLMTREALTRLGHRPPHFKEKPTDTAYLERAERDAISRGKSIIRAKPICQKMRIHGNNDSLASV